jgi:RNA-directed DNA polymerase
VLRMDLADFFPTIGRGRVVRLFETLGYPPDVARQLAGLCTNTAPRELWSEELVGISRAGDAEAMRRQSREWERLYARPHLPQGAPTSGAIANLCAFRLDCRLAGLAKRAGADYSRYADDLLFSGEAEFSRRAEHFAAHVAAICLDEGFQVQHRKTRIQRAAARQEAAGVVLNVRPNIRREEYDRLKAILHNCRRHGPASQNRAALADFRAHLLGRIAHVAMLHPERGQRLRTMFDRVAWTGMD